MQTTTVAPPSSSSDATRLCSLISTPAAAACAGEAPHPAGGLEHAVGDVPEGGGEALLEGRLEAVDPLGREAGRDERLVLGPELVALLLVDGDAQRADAAEGVARERLDRVDRALGPGGQGDGLGLAHGLRRDVERGRHPAQREAAVAPARALGDPARVVQPHALSRLREPERGGAAGHAAADDDDVRVVDGHLRALRRRLAEPVGGHRRILRQSSPAHRIQPEAPPPPR